MVQAGKAHENVGAAQEQVERDDLLRRPIEDLFRRYKSSETGLTWEEAERSLSEYGPNELAKQKKRSTATHFLAHFANPLILILLLAGTVTGFLGEVTNTVIIYAIVLMSIILEFYQESKAERAAETLRQKISTTATVLRNGIRQEIRLSLVTPGDVIYLAGGDIVPADARVISAKDFFVDQSSLTGESFPVEKTQSPPADSGPLALTEWNNYLFMGTSVVSGSATAIVLKTGSSTEFGGIAKTLSARGSPTEFERGLNRFGYLILQMTLVLVTFVFIILALFRQNFLDSLLFAVALAVGLTPELLPIILTVNLSNGAQAMSKKKVIVKRLASIQNFGNMDVLCTDKTGTLTENKVALILHIDIGGRDSNKVLLYSYMNSFFQTGLKSPLDEAVLQFGTLDIPEWHHYDPWRQLDSNSQLHKATPRLLQHWFGRFSESIWKQLV